jgi:hypothetical protein
MPEKVLHYFLVIVRVGEKPPPKGRTTEAIGHVKRVAERFSYQGREYQLAFSSHDGATLGLFIMSDAHPNQIRAALYDKPMEVDTPPLLNEDSCLILELGEDFSGRGFSRAWAWLQRH